MTDAALPPSADASGTLDAALAAVRVASASDNTVAAFELLAARLTEVPTMPQVLTTLRRELHRVRGTAAGHGFGEAARIAGAMETLATRWLDDASLDNERRGAIVAQFARSLGEALTHPHEFAAAGAGTPAARRLLLVGLSDDIASGVIAEGVARGFRVERVPESEAARALDRDRPSAIVAAVRAFPEGAAPGVPRVLLRASDADDDLLVPTRGQRMLDGRASAREILDVLELLEHLGGSAAGKVVVVDDDPVVRALLTSLLGRDGLDAEAFAGAPEFLAALDDLDPMVLVLDGELPESSGVELTRAVRAIPARADVPILMLTAHTGAAMRAAAFAAGADDYMVKPIVPAEFQRRVTRLVEARRRQRVAVGLEAGTGLPTRTRTLRELEARLRTAGESSVSVVVVRPRAPSGATAGKAAWLSECARVARAIRDAGGLAGFLDDVGLGGVVPVRPWQLSALLTQLFDEGPDDAPQWHAGIVGRDLAAPLTPRALIDAAETACVAARDSARRSRVWNPGDFDIAPDVVLVEDDDTLAEMLAFALSARGLTHRRFATGPAALDALLLMRPHGRAPIVLLEVDLPGLDGHSLHERLRIERPDAFDVVFLSSHANEAEQLRALQGGALDYMSKPVNLRVLVAKLSSWHSRHRSA